MRHQLVLALAIVCYATGLTRLFYRLNRRAKRIITFHNVLPARLLPQGKAIGMTDTEDTFRMKVREVGRHFGFSTDVLGTPRAAVITFDDGYLNQAETAGRILREEGDIPAIVFAAGDVLGNTRPESALTVDLLLHWTQLAPDGRYDLGPAGTATLTPHNRDSVWQTLIWPAFAADSDSKGRCLLGALDKACPLSQILSDCEPEYLRLRLHGITASHVRGLRQRGWEVGWHTRQHFPLSRLATPEKEEEISDAPAEMKRHPFSYPYGELFSVDDECVRMAREAGYPCAVSNMPDAGGHPSRFFLPRFTLSDNRFLLHFELSGLKHFICHRKLLPIV